MRSNIDLSLTTRLVDQPKTPALEGNATSTTTTQLLTPASSTFSSEETHALRPRVCKPQLRRSHRQRRPSFKTIARMTPESSPALPLIDRQEDITQHQIAYELPAEDLQLESDLSDGPAFSEPTVFSEPMLLNVVDTPATASPPAVSSQEDDESELSDVDEEFLRSCERKHGRVHSPTKVSHSEARRPFRPLSLGQLADQDPEIQAALAMQAYPTYNPFGYSGDTITLPRPVPIAQLLPAQFIRRKQVEPPKRKLDIRPPPPPSKRPRSAKSKASDTISAYSWHKPSGRR